MLKNIPPVLSPELLKILCEMGHSDRLVIGDGNFPSESVGRNAHVIRMDGHGVCEVLDAILTLFPLDSYVQESVKIMDKVPGDEVDVIIWDEFVKILTKHGYDKNVMGKMERFDFYKAAREVYLVIATSEKELYANIMLQKGVI